ncbi:unnamed protein product, partial [Mesorhabditis spiculigera]
MARLLTILLLASFSISVWPLTMKMYSAVPNVTTEETFPIYLSIQEQFGGHQINQLDALLLTTYKNGRFEGDTAVFDEALTAEFAKGLDQWFGVTFLLCESPSPAPGMRCPTCGKKERNLLGENKGKLPDRLEFACIRKERRQSILITIGQVRVCDHVVLLLECAPCIDDPDPAATLAFLHVRLPSAKPTTRQTGHPKKHINFRYFAKF